MRFLKILISYLFGADFSLALFDSETFLFYLDVFWKTIGRWDYTYLLYDHKTFYKLIIYFF